MPEKWDHVQTIYNLSLTAADTQLSHLKVFNFYNDKFRKYAASSWDQMGKTCMANFVLNHTYGEYLWVRCPQTPHEFQKQWLLAWLPSHQKGRMLSWNSKYWRIGRPIFILQTLNDIWMAPLNCWSELTRNRDNEEPEEHLNRMKWLHLIKLFPLGQVTSVHLLQQAHKCDRLSAPLEWIFKATLWVMEDSTNPTRLELVRDYVSSQLK